MHILRRDSWPSVSACKTCAMDKSLNEAILGLDRLILLTICPQINSSSLVCQQSTRLALCSSATHALTYHPIPGIPTGIPGLFLHDVFYKTIASLTGDPCQPAMITPWSYRNLHMARKVRLRMNVTNEICYLGSHLVTLEFPPS